MRGVTGQEKTPVSRVAQALQPDRSDPRDVIAASNERRINESGQALPPGYTPPPPSPVKQLPPPDAPITPDDLLEQRAWMKSRGIAGHDNPDDTVIAGALRTRREYRSPAGEAIVDQNLQRLRAQGVGGFPVPMQTPDEQPPATNLTRNEYGQQVVSTAAQASGLTDQQIDADYAASQAPDPVQVTDQDINAYLRANPEAGVRLRGTGAAADQKLREQVAQAKMFPDGPDGPQLTGKDADYRFRHGPVDRDTFDVLEAAEQVGGSVAQRFGAQRYLTEYVEGKLRDEDPEQFVKITDAIFGQVNKQRERQGLPRLITPAERDAQLTAAAVGLGIPLRFPERDAEPEQPKEPPGGFKTQDEAVAYEAAKVRRAEWEKQPEAGPKPMSVLQQQVEAAMQRRQAKADAAANRERLADKGLLERAAGEATFAAGHLGAGVWESTASTAAGVVDLANLGLKKLGVEDTVPSDMHPAIKALRGNGTLGRMQQKLAERPEASGVVGTVTGPLNQGLGSIIPFMLGGWAGNAIKGGRYLAPALMGSAVNANQVRREAIEYGATEEEADKAMVFGAVLGLSEAAPIGRAFERTEDAYQAAKQINRMTKGQLFKRINKHGLGEAFEEAGQEGLQTFGNDLILARYIDGNREQFETLLQDSSVGAGVGYILGTVMSSLGLGKRRFDTARQRKEAFDAIKKFRAERDTAQQSDQARQELDQRQAEPQQSPQEAPQAPPQPAPPEPAPAPTAPETAAIAPQGTDTPAEAAPSGPEGGRGASESGGLQTLRQELAAIENQYPEYVAFAERQDAPEPTAEQQMPRELVDQRLRLKQRIATMEAEAQADGAARPQRYPDDARDPNPGAAAAQPAVVDQVGEVEAGPDAAAAGGPGRPVETPGRADAQGTGVAADGRGQGLAAGAPDRTGALNPVPREQLSRGQQQSVESAEAAYRKAFNDESIKIEVVDPDEGEVFDVLRKQAELFSADLPEGQRLEPIFVSLPEQARDRPGILATAYRDADGTAVQPYLVDVNNPDQAIFAYALHEVDHALEQLAPEVWRRHREHLQAAAPTAYGEAQRQYRLAEARQRVPDAKGKKVRDMGRQRRLRPDSPEAQSEASAVLAEAVAADFGQEMQAWLTTAAGTGPKMWQRVKQVLRRLARSLRIASRGTAHESTIEGYLAEIRRLLEQKYEPALRNYQQRQQEERRLRNRAANARREVARRVEEEREPDAPEDTPQAQTTPPAPEAPHQDPPPTEDPPQVGAPVNEKTVGESATPATMEARDETAAGQPESVPARERRGTAVQQAPARGRGDASAQGVQPAEAADRGQAPKRARRRPKTRPRKRLSRAEVERRLIANARDSLGLEEVRRLGDLEAIQQQFDGANPDQSLEVSTTFAGPLPTELVTALEGKTHLLSKLRSNKGKGQGEDTLSALGEDGFVTMLEAAHRSELEQAKELARGATDFDPAAAFYAHLLDNWPRQDAGFQTETIAKPDEALNAGDRLTIFGDTYMIETIDGHSALVNEDGEIVTYLTALDDMIVDKGSVERDAADAETDEKDERTAIKAESEGTLEYRPDESPDLPFAIRRPQPLDLDKNALNLYTEAFGQEINRHGRLPAPDPITRRATAIGPSQSGYTAPSGHEGAAANGFDFPAAVRRRASQTHRAVDEASERIAEAMGLPTREGAEGLISEELINRLRDTSGVGDPVIARLRQHIPIIPLARLEQLDKAVDVGTEVAAVYFDPAQDAVYKVYEVEDGVVTQGIGVGELVRTGDRVDFRMERDTPLTAYLRQVDLANRQGGAVFTEVAGISDAGDLILKQPRVHGAEPGPGAARRMLNARGLAEVRNGQFDGLAAAPIDGVPHIYIDLHEDNLMRNRAGHGFLLDARLRPLQEQEAAALDLGGEMPFAIKRDPGQTLKAMVDHFGLTRDPAEAGFILPDGRMLDLSGRRDADGYKRDGDQYRHTGKGSDFLAGQRSLDHRELPDSIAGVDGNDPLRTVEADGVLRVDVTRGQTMASSSAPMTDAQVRALARAHPRGDAIYIDLYTPDGWWITSLWQDNATPADLKRELERANRILRGEERPPADDGLRFSIAGAGLNLNRQQMADPDTRARAVEKARTEWLSKGYDSKYFRQWFRRSKVAAPDGKPKVVYHGTRNTDLFGRDAFAAFFTDPDNTAGIAGSGAYFAENPEIANSFGRTGVVYPVVLSIQNPLDLDTWDSAIAEKLMRALRAEGRRVYADSQALPLFNSKMRLIQAKTNRNEYDSLMRLLHDVGQAGGYNLMRVVQPTLKAAGYDGLTHLADDALGGVKRFDGGAGRVWVAYKPQQIKSVNNAGTFAENRPEVLFAIRRGPAPGSGASGRQLGLLGEAFDTREEGKSQLDREEERRQAQQTPEDGETGRLFAIRGAGDRFALRGVVQTRTDIDGLGLYSPLRRTIADLGGKPEQRYTGKQMLGMLRKRPGIKPEELEWSGLIDFLTEQEKVTKPQVLDFLDRNAVAIEEVVRGKRSRNPERKRLTDERKRVVAELEAINTVSEGDEVISLGQVGFRGGYPQWGAKRYRAEAASDGRLVWKRQGQYGRSSGGRQLSKKLRDELTRQAEADGIPVLGVTHNQPTVGGDSARVGELQERLKVLDREIDKTPALVGKEPGYKDYQLPGGKNYREVLLTLPDPAPLALRDGMEARQMPDGTWNVWDRDGWVYREGFATREAMEAATARDDMLATKDQPAFRSIHWDEPNVLAHVRLNDRTDEQGRKVLFVEEVQSDFGQAYRSQRVKWQNEVQGNFKAVAARMQRAGVLEIDCD